MAYGSGILITVLVIFYGYIRMIYTGRPRIRRILNLNLALFIWIAGYLLTLLYPEGPLAGVSMMLSLMGVGCTIIALPMVLLDLDPDYAHV